MAVCYILDGYNITTQIPHLSFKKLKASREGLLRLIQFYHPQGSRKNEVVIVFDGKPGVGGFMEQRETRVIFSENESADDRIRKLVEHSKRKKEIIVVTDDKDLATSIRILGASVLGVKDFLSKVKREPQEQGLADEKRISKTLEFEITEEMERIWLKSKNSK